MQLKLKTKKRKTRTLLNVYDLQKFSPRCVSVLRPLYVLAAPLVHQRSQHNHSGTDDNSQRYSRFLAGTHSTGGGRFFVDAAHSGVVNSVMCVIRRSRSRRRRRIGTGRRSRRRVMRRRRSWRWRRIGRGRVRSRSRSRRRRRRQIRLRSRSRSRRFGGDVD
uniref:Uncharacterized protein n=1 Tax=Glycine max TaxID=3847 RepID=C6T5D1_SOYBN|nr:unknown [Glycine max]ACU17504.1 unknown [Glycine max]